MTDCDIYSADGHKFHTERALWDTGADTTIISSRIVTELALQPYIPHHQQGRQDHLPVSHTQRGRRLSHLDKFNTC